MESWWRHRERRLAENKAWRTANREQWLAGMKAWRMANPDRANLLNRLKKQRRRAAGVLTAADWELGDRDLQPSMPGLREARGDH